MSITKNVLLSWCCSMKFFFGKIPIFFDIENWLWSSNFCNFWQRLLNWTWDLKSFYRAGYWPWVYRKACKMCNSVGQKLGHTKRSIWQFSSGLLMYWDMLGSRVSAHLLQTESSKKWSLFCYFVPTVCSQADQTLFWFPTLHNRRQSGSFVYDQGVLCEANNWIW